MQLFGKVLVGGCTRTLFSPAAMFRLGRIGRIRLNSSVKLISTSVTCKLSSSFKALTSSDNTKGSDLEQTVRNSEMLVNNNNNTNSSCRNMASIDSITERLQAFGITDELKNYPGSNITQNPYDIFRCYITEQLSKVSGVSEDLIYPALEWTNSSERGDLIIPVPRLRIKGAKPNDLAVEWTDKFEKGKYLEKILAVGPFIQFYFDRNLLFNIVIKDVLKLEKNFGQSNIGAGKKVVVEFSSPNIAKPFHAGHLRSTIIGGFISNLYEKAGWEVIRLNYLGDWGKQFGVLAVGFERYGSEEKLEADPINHLFEVYVQINKDMEAEKEKTLAQTGVATSETDNNARAFFRAMESGDEKALDLWSKFRTLSIEKYKSTYARLNINYDTYSGESQVSQESMRTATEQLQKLGLVTEDQGALLIDLTPHNKKLGKVIVQKKDGTTLYITRDIGGAVERYEKYKFDKMIYVIACQQDLHCQQFFKTLELMGHEWHNRLQHINFGMVQGMSTRKGTVVFLDNILEETKEAMHNVMRKNEAKYAQVANPDEIADLVGISAVMIQDMQSKRINNYTFNWERMLSFEGDTGPYLQYAHSRLCSVRRNASSISDDELLSADYSLLAEPVAADLIKTIAQYPDVILNALKTHEPATIVTYLFKLTHIVSSCYDILWVAGQTPELAAARLALYMSARQTLNNGMTLLGLTPVIRM
ncbi:arginyl-tRNA synthetase [Nadsonia fulvescens var. elongata DSM 6958]|uniref:arginine--tRNA ligase n=1 Tax=Nadsonia fulvescens var. elongata DSM 6958 TaxID=857566 RepID=A0A1E3PLX4_9ASCO|nr:arginyl-tRNA synthetase [Nadsonia fulvescens var. elongata DSM 6958]